MYKKIKKIENVHRYNVLTGEYIYKKDENYLTRFKCSEIEGVKDLMSYNDLYIIRKGEGDTYIYKNGELVKESYSAYLLSDMSDKGFIFPDEGRFSKEFDTKVSYCNIFDLNTFEEILTESVPYELEYTKGIIIGVSHVTYKIVRLSKDTSIVWEYDLHKELPKYKYYKYQLDFIKKKVGIVGVNYGYTHEEVVYWH